MTVIDVNVPVHEFWRVAIYLLGEHVRSAHTTTQPPSQKDLDEVVKEISFKELNERYPLALELMKRTEPNEELLASLCKRLFVYLPTENKLDFLVTVLSAADEHDLKLIEAITTRTDFMESDVLKQRIEELGPNVSPQLLLGVVKAFARDQEIAEIPGFNDR